MDRLRVAFSLRISPRIQSRVAADARRDDSILDLQQRPVFGFWASAME
jgi:hypothetical protein